MKTPTRAAVYARISSDVEGTRAGVERQLSDCRSLATSLGWQVAAEYVDNDLSAYSGKPRPEYRRMLDDLAGGRVDGVLVYNIDRLTRRPAELEQFHEAVKGAGVRHVSFVTGDADLGTDDGLMMARMLGVFAAKESANIARRVRRKMEQNALDGKPHGGTVRPFGYAADKITVDPTEAELLRTVVARFLAGESTRSLATWLSDQEVPTVTGRPWITTTLKGMLTNPRYAGLRAYKGAVVGPAIWAPIITEDEHRRILAKYAEKKASGRRTPQRYLLSGMLRCGKCGTRLYSSARRAHRRYVCMKGPDHGGCGRLTVVAEPVERLVSDAVLYRLDTPELADALAGRRGSDERTQALTEQITEGEARMEELALAFGMGEISMKMLRIAKGPIEARIESATRQLGKLTRTDALTGWIGNSQGLAQTWTTLNLSVQHEVVKALIDHIAIAPGTPGATALDSGRVAIAWSL